MSDTAERQPDAQGTLGDTPLPHLVLYLYRRNTSGTLQLSTQEHGILASIAFRQGRPIAARLDAAAPTLLASLIPLCGVRDADFTFFADELLGEGEDLVTGSIDPYALLIASLRDHAHEDMVAAVIERYAGRKLRLQPGRDLERLVLERDDKPLIELIRAAPATPEELVKQSPLGERRTRHLLYALIVTHMLGLHEERNHDTFRSQVELKEGASGSPAPGGLPSLGAPAWQRLASLRASPMSPASPRARIVSPPPTSGRPADTSVVASLPAPPPASVPSAPSPASEDRASRLRQAEQFLQRGRADDAIAVADEMLREEPESAELHALRGYALFEKHRSEEEGLPRSVVDALKKALEIDGDHARALYIRGLVYQRGGDAKKALACFKRVLQVQPKHIEAQREVRLARLRAAKP